MRYSIKWLLNVRAIFLLFPVPRAQSHSQCPDQFTQHLGSVV